MPLMCWHVKIEITTTSLRPDIVLWSTSANGMIIAIPWKKNNGSLWEIKKYREATVTCAEAGWKAQIYPVEVRWMDFVRESTPQLPKPLRVPGSEQKRHSRITQERALLAVTQKKWSEVEKLRISGQATNSNEPLITVTVNCSAIQEWLEDRQGNLLAAGKDWMQAG